jgi:YgiT-type zinc finger domain-containing protein
VRDLPTKGQRDGRRVLLPFEQAQRELDAWHATHPDATFYDMELAVEAQIARLRTALLGRQPATRFHEEQPACPHCGTTMVASSRRRKRVVMKGDETLDLHRTYVVCPACGEGLFPPG